METRRLGRTNFNASVLGFGSAPVGYLKTDRDRAGEVMNLLLDAGVNLIDTAANYPGSEELIAEQIGHRRDQFFLVSKCGTNRTPEVSAPAWSAQNVLDTVDRSLRVLKTDRLDCMLLHSCDLDTLKKGEALGALAKARDAGKIRFAGYSGDNDAAAWAAAHPDVAVIETSINLADQVNIDQVLPVTQAHDVGVLAKRPVANAAWKDLSQQQGLYATYAKTYTTRLKAMNLDLTSLELGADVDWPDLAMRFTLTQPGVHCAIIGTTNPNNARANLRFAEKAELPPAAIDRIRTAFRRAEQAAGTAWTGQT